MRIAFVFTSKSPFGGAKRRLTRIYNAICSENDALKCDIFVRGCDLNAALVQFRRADCELSSINHIYAFKSQFKSLLYILFSRKYKIIHFYDAGKYYLIMQLACKLLNKKNIYTVCSYQEAYNCFSERYMKAITRRLRLADHVDLLYPAGIDFVSRYVKKGRLSITPGTFTDLTLFKPQKKDKTIVYAAARLEDVKNPVLFIECINECSDAIRAAGYRVILLGEGEYEEHIKKFVCDNGLTDIVDLAGYDRTSKYLPTASVFFSTQTLENYPSQSLAEAAASGCYCIITDVGDSRKCADDSFAAFVNANTEELSQALIRYMGYGNPEKEAIVASARAFAEANYSIEASKIYYSEMLLKLS